uniref:Uncharacterized protein n=1 Tax=Anguilla anguilla TaxID=7936 RepID=A0A0E9SWW0_ANGAN
MSSQSALNLPQGRIK